MDGLRKKLFFQSHHMGTKENDLIFGKFAEQCLENLSPDEVLEYQTLLACSDIDLMAWIMRNQDPEDTSLQPMIEKIRSHSQNI